MKGDLGHVVRLPGPDPGRAVQGLHPRERVRRQPLLVGLSRRDDDRDHLGRARRGGARRAARGAPPTLDAGGVQGRVRAHAHRRAARPVKPQRLRPGVRAHRAHADPRRPRGGARARTSTRSPAATRARSRACPGTHFARWVVIDDVVYQGSGQRHRDAPQGARGCCSRATSTGSSTPTWRRCAPAWATTPTRSGATAAAIPGTRTAGAFAAYMRAPPARERRCSSPPTATSTVERGARQPRARGAR